MALQIELTLGTAAYATMALREVTKTETSSHYQTILTQASEDQQFKGTADVGQGDVDADGEDELEEGLEATETVEELPEVVNDGNTLMVDA